MTSLPGTATGHAERLVELEARIRKLEAANEELRRKVDDLWRRVVDVLPGCR